MQETEQRTWGMRTRKSNKLENRKQKMMCEALTKAENSRKLPEIEGELPEMPEGEADEDFEEKTGKRASKSSGKRGKKGVSAVVGDEEA